MKNRIATSLYILTALFAGSCNSIEIPANELPDFEPKLSINSSIDNENIISLKIENTVNPFTTDVPAPYKDVDISLTGASSGTFPVSFDASCNCFVSNKAAKPGEVYTLQVKDKLGKYSTATATTYMPAKLLDKKVEFALNGGIDMEGKPSDLISVSWTDIAGSQYYIAHFLYYSEAADLFIPFDFALDDPSLAASETIKLDDGGYLFSDKLFNGQKKKISVVPPGGLVAGNSDILYLVQIRTVSNEYFKYYNTLNAYRENADLVASGSSENTVIVYNNIENGAGIFMGSTIDSDTIR
ncbi:MAG: DUF4249 domain-containing protein [Flavobacteriales bacterium]|nr:DUF4249 domain-containing protein [Flavobacteriales bacterium]